MSHFPAILVYTENSDHFATIQTVVQNPAELQAAVEKMKKHLGYNPYVVINKKLKATQVTLKAALRWKD